MTLTLKAYAKLNLMLDILSTLPNGYHDLFMVMQSVSLYDLVTLDENDSGALTVSCSDPAIPAGEGNLAYKAAKRFFDETGLPMQGLDIHIEKHIPHAAGLAGGSADAAAVLRALNRMYGAPLTPDELETLAARVGSDVPFCVRGGTALATGRGEKLEALPPLPVCKFVVCKPDFSISTPELFRKLDQTGLRCHPDTAGILDALRRGELRQICRRMYNVFEDVDDRRLRTVAEIKGRLLDCGALGAIMTGTGSAVFGVFRPGSIPPDAAESLRRDYGFCEEAVCVPRLL